jgi:uncharacterized integral membrane protein
MQKPGAAQPYGGQPTAPYTSQPTTPYAPPGAPPAPTQGRLKQGPGWGVYAVTVLALLLLVAVVVFIVQNTDTTEIQFFWWTGRVTIAGAIGVGALAGLLVGLIVGFILQIPLRKRLKAANRQATQVGVPRA